MKILLSGFGVVGKAVIELIEQQRPRLYSKHGLSPTFVGVIDSRGAAIDPRGLDPSLLLETKAKQGSVGAMPAHGVRDAKELDIIAESEAQLLIEATPTTVKTPGPSLERLKLDGLKTVVCVTTGHGLKDPDAMSKAPVKMHQIKPTLDAIRKVLDS